MEERLLSLAEACEVLGKSERTVYRWIKSGKLKAYKPGRDYEIPESAIREMRERSEVYPKDLEPSLPFEGVAAAPLEKVAGSLQAWGAYINELATDLEEWSFGFHKGGDPSDLPEREFLAFVGGVSVAGETYRRAKGTVEPLAVEHQDEDLARAWRRLSRVMQTMVTPGVERRLNEMERGTLPDNVVSLTNRKTA